MGPFDQTGRQAAKDEPADFFDWLLPIRPPIVLPGFEQWDDTRRTSWPGGPTANVTAGRDRAGRARARPVRAQSGAACRLGGPRPASLLPRPVSLPSDAANAPRSAP